MDYCSCYERLIKKAQRRHLFEYSERHHVVPRSLGGSNDFDNLVRLTVKEHFLAHLLLIKIGYVNQVFAIEAFINDQSSHRKNLKWNKWLRRVYNRETAKLARQRNRIQLGYDELHEDIFELDCESDVQEPTLFELLRSAPCHTKDAPRL